MRKVIYGLLAIVGPLLNAAVPIQENFRCGVKGFDYVELDFQRFGDLYRVQSSRLDQIPPRHYEFVIPVAACQSDSTSSYHGVFSCQETTGGKAIIQTKARRYQSIKIDVRYEEEENDYEPSKAKWPIWYLRVAEITFIGADFPAHGEKYNFKTRVNYNEPGDFREVCWLDGKIIQR